MGVPSPRTNSGFMIQSPSGNQGSFELVYPSQLGGAIHCWRDNDAPGFPWQSQAPFGAGEVAAVSLIQSNLGSPGLGHLEVVARVGDRLAHYWRKDVAHYEWFGPTAFFGGGVSGNPALIQGRLGVKGDFEVVVPLASGGLAHFWRNNDVDHPPGGNGHGGRHEDERPWNPSIFGTGIGQMEGAALIQSNFGPGPGNLEVIATVVSGSTRALVHFFRESVPPYAWSGPTFLPAFPNGGPRGRPGFIQAKNGIKGHFTVVVGLTSGGLGYIWRDNDSPELLWQGSVFFGSGDVDEVSLLQSSFGPPPGNLVVAARLGARTVIYHRDEAGWQGPSDPVPPEAICDPSTQGEWRVPHSSAVVGVHTVLLRNGGVLFYTYKEDSPGQRDGDCAVLDPETLVEKRPFIDPLNPFCGGQAVLPDGRVLAVGGHEPFPANPKNVLVFTPDNEAGGFWHKVGEMPRGRWYPTLTVLADGRVFILSGTDNGPQDGTRNLNATWQVYDPASQALSPPQPAPILEEMAPYSLYPFVYLLPDGRLVIHGNNLTGFFNTATASFEPGRLRALRGEPRTYNIQGTSVLLPLLPSAGYRPRVMLFGGGGLTGGVPTSGTPATATCEILDLGDPSPAWREAPPMSAQRVMPDAVLLPDATVLVMNGSHRGKADDGAIPVYNAEVYNPVTNSWRILCPMRIPRLYHSTALLLPDGRVLTAGTDGEFNPHPFHRPEHRVEIFSPPYLFNGPRPVITGVPGEVTWGADFNVDTPDAGSVVSAAFIRPGAVTHSFNHDQRYVGLEIVARSAGTLTLRGPLNGNVAPPGFYMLFLLDEAGVPSRAPLIRLR